VCKSGGSRNWQRKGNSQLNTQFVWKKHGFYLSFKKLHTRPDQRPLPTVRWNVVRAWHARSRSRVQVPSRSSQRYQNASELRGTDVSSLQHVSWLLLRAADISLQSAVEQQHCRVSQLITSQAVDWETSTESAVVCNDTRTHPTFVRPMFSHYSTYVDFFTELRTSQVTSVSRRWNNNTAESVNNLLKQ